MEKDRTHLTYGLLEVTHSSARITYEVKIDGNSSLTANENIGTLELYAEEYSVFTQSIPCYGLRAAYRQFQHHLIDKVGWHTSVYFFLWSKPKLTSFIRD